MASPGYIWICIYIYISIYTLFYPLFFFNFLRTHFYPLFFFNFLRAHFYPLFFFSVFKGLWASGGSSSFSSSNFLSNATGIMSGDQFSNAVMTIFINVTILDIRADGRTVGPDRTNNGNQEPHRTKVRTGFNQESDWIVRTGQDLISIWTGF